MRKWPPFLNNRPTLNTVAPTILTLYSPVYSSTVAHQPPMNISQLTTSLLFPRWLPSLLATLAARNMNVCTESGPEVVLLQK